MDFEGVDEAVSRTRKVVDFAAQKMVDGHRVMIFPETNHHVEHWMRVWVVGYLEIAFRAAEKTAFQKDIRIVPAAHHYSSYYGIQGSYLLRYDKPFSLMPYYERYRQKPRTTIREINTILRERVKNMMLYTDDLEHHDLYDFIRLSHVGEQHAVDMHLQPEYLPERLESDRKLWAELEAGAAEKPELLTTLTDMMNRIREKEYSLHLREHAAEKRPQCVPVILLSLFAQILLLPLWLVSLFPSAIMYYIPPMFMPGKEDPYYRVYTQSMQFIVSLVILIPVFSLTALLVLGLCWGWWWQAILWIVSWYPLALFAWYEGQWMRRTWDSISLRCHKAGARQLAELYKSLYETVSTLVAG